jgi:hypothetical protein
MRLLLLGIALLAFAGPALAEEEASPRIYRWVDENGIAHYTTDPDRIPASLRRRYGLPAEPLRSAPLDAHAPASAQPAPAAPEAWAGQEKGDAPPAPTPAERTAGAEEGMGEPSASATADVAAGPAADRLSQIELRIAELSASIAADEDALSAWIGDPTAGDPIELGAKPEFREIAQRLPIRIQELEALQRERDALVTAVP